MSLRPPCSATGSTEYSFLLQESRRKRRKSIIKWMIITLLILVFSLLTIFLAVFVGIPLIFKYSKEVQRSWIFPRFSLLPTNPEFTNFEKYNLRGARNTNYTLHTENEGNIFLGMWHILPEDLIKYSMYNKNFDYENELARSDDEHPVLLHFHGTGANRIQYLNMYRVLRRFFHVIAFDYRGYGDSTSLPPTEAMIVEDSLKLYTRLKSQTRAEVYLWGHGLGASLATRTAAMARDSRKGPPAGLFLESAFTTLKEELRESAFYKIFSWLPWFESTMLQPLEENGFHFRTIDYTNKVDCPIMMVHSEYDEIVPYSLGERLYNVTKQQRNIFQGNVTFHGIPADYRIGHYGTSMLRKLPLYVHEHIVNCRRYSRSNNGMVIEDEEAPLPEGHIHF